MTKKKLLSLIILLSSISLIVLIIIQYVIYIDYLNSSGKNRAFFGLLEFLKYGYRHYLGIIPLIGFIISLIFSTDIDLRRTSIVAALISLTAILFSFLSIWEIFI